MELHKALRHVIKAEGQDIIKELRLVNILDDFNAYTDLPAAKYILRAIISDGYMDKYLSIGRLNNQMEMLSQKISNNTGFNHETVILIFTYIAYGLGWIEEVTNPSTRLKEHDKIEVAPQHQANVDSQHISFKGIPVNSTKEEFLTAIEGIGMTRSTKNWDNFALFFGPFAEIDDCVFRVEFSPFNGQVYEVQVWMPSQDSWVECKSRYLDFKTRLISKYGTPDSCVEFFEFPYCDAEGKGDELELLRNDKIIY